MTTAQDALRALDRLVGGARFSIFADGEARGLVDDDEKTLRSYIERTAAPAEPDVMALAEKLAEAARRLVFFLNFVEAARQVEGEPPLNDDYIIASCHPGGGSDWITVKHFRELRQALSDFAAAKGGEG